MRLLFLVLASCAAVALGAQQSYDGYKVYSVQLQTAEQLEAFVGIQKYNVDFWDTPNKDNRPFRVMVQPDMVDTFEFFLATQNIPANVIIQNAEEVLSQELARNARAKRYNRISNRSSISFDHFFRYEEIVDFLKDAVEDRPDLVSLESVGKSSQGRDLWLVKISNTGFDGSKPVIFIDANIHAREWISCMTVLYLIHELVEHDYEVPEMFEVDWMIMPMANPDGYEFSHVGDRMWRKTRSQNAGSNCFGTDANRNFAYQWNVAAGTSDDPCSLVYRGSAAETEPEVLAISNLLRNNRNLIKLYLAIHSFGDYLLYPYGYALNVANSHDANLNALGTRVQQAILGVNPNRSYTVGNSADLLYTASGTSDDFASGAAGINYSYCVELSGGGALGFDPAPQEIMPISKEIFYGYREYAIYVAQNF